MASVRSSPFFTFLVGHPLRASGACRITSMEQTPEAVWKACLEIIRDNISRQSFKTWFEPLKAVSLETDGDLIKLTVQLPSREDG